MRVRSRLLQVACLAMAVTACMDDTPTVPVAPPIQPSSPQFSYWGFTSAALKYQVKMETRGWTDWYMNGEHAGASFANLKMHAARFQLAGSSSPHAQVCAQAHLAYIGWQPEVCGTDVMVGSDTSPEEIQALRIRVRNTPDLSVCYRGVVQNVGWTDQSCNGAMMGTVGQALQLQTILVVIHKPFYAYSARWALSPDSTGPLTSRMRVRMAQGPLIAMDTSFDRAFVSAGNCEKPTTLTPSEASFIASHAGTGRIYVIGDEPDHHTFEAGANPCGTPDIYTPTEYAQVFRALTQQISSLDPSARFSNGGFTRPNARDTTAAGNFTAFANNFISAYNSLYGVNPPIAEWRFNINGVDEATLKAHIDTADTWSSGRKLFLVYQTNPSSDMAAVSDYIKQKDSVAGAAWWGYDHDMSGALANSSGMLTAFGVSFLENTI